MVTSQWGEFVEWGDAAPAFAGGVDAVAADRRSPDEFWFFKGDQVMKADIVTRQVVEPARSIAEKWPLVTADYAGDICAAFMPPGAIAPILALVKPSGDAGFLDLDGALEFQIATVWDQIGAAAPAGFTGIDAAMPDPADDGHLYLFSGKQSLRCNLMAGTVEAPTATADRWTGVRATGPGERVDAALSRPDDTVVHLLHGDTYISLDLATQTCRATS
ncbi:hemopexin repeat-containing protein [Streptomyces sp. CBMA152]|uniref:hemopexin repeat-containing protein n=1 Tax=Streptomyces sp. CBMA152 TaxID=1896312 RepID=UPI00166075D7|nr:hemopexin repeat-containing protein [Streptomyces sp. CBMA152]